MKKIITYTLTLVLWAVFLILAFKGIAWPFVSLTALHLIELMTVGFSTGREYGWPVLRCIVMCMLFGFLWWLPIKRIIEEDNLTDEDFIDDGLQPWREKQ